MIKWIRSKKDTLTVIAAIAGLITATASLIHSIKEPGAAKAYETLRIAVETNSDAVIKNHDDIIRVMLWIDDLRKADEINRVNFCGNSSLFIAPSVNSAQITDPPPIKKTNKLPYISSKPKTADLPKAL